MSVESRHLSVGPSIHKGPTEGLIIVNGRPQVERADMPTISFDSIQALMRISSESGLGAETSDGETEKGQSQEGKV